MAISDTITPYANLIDDFAKEVSYFPERIPQICDNCLERILRLNREEVRRGIGVFLQYAINALYGGNEEKRRMDVARLVVGGKVDDIELTDEDRIAVTALLIKVCEEKFGKEPLSVL